MNLFDIKILKMEADLQKKLDKKWAKSDYSLRHDYTNREHHEVHEKAELWDKLLKEIKSFEFIKCKEVRE